MTPFSLFLFHWHRDFSILRGQSMKFTDHLPKLNTVLKATFPQVGDERDGFRERRQRRYIFLYNGLVLAFGPVPVFGTSR
jgi:hypothetical protein